MPLKVKRTPDLRNGESVEKTEIGPKILAYLVRHPDARDTFEGIVEWWLLEQEIAEGAKAVKKVLAELVGEGLITEHRGADSRVHYQIDRSKYGDILTFIEASLP